MTDRTTIALDARPELVRRAWSLTGSRADAEDIVQDAYLRILPKLATIEPASAIPGVLWVTARNRWYDITRRNRIVTMQPLPDRWLGNRFERAGADEVPAALLTDSTEDLVLDLLDLLRVHEVLPLLRPDQAALLIAVYWRDEPVGTNNTRKSQIRRARLAFREAWERAA